MTRDDDNVDLSDEDEDIDALLEEDDAETRALHAKRLAELKDQAAQSQSTSKADSPEEGDASGHGSNHQSQPRRINIVALSTPTGKLTQAPSEKIAMEAVASAEKSILLFTHEAFPTCSSMAKHLTRLANQFRSTVFLSVDAEKAKWLCQKLGIRVLPCVIGYLDGEERGRITGFEGLYGGPDCKTASVEAVFLRWKVVIEREKLEAEYDDDGDESDDEHEGARRSGTWLSNGQGRLTSRLNS